MISHGKDVKVFAANANRPFAADICKELNIPLGNSTVTTFADGEVSVSFNAVSYTHLDVYKRQTLACSPFFPRMTGDKI